MSVIKDNYKPTDAFRTRSMTNPELVPGVNILKTKNGLMIETYSTGTNGQTDDPVDIDTVYDIASITKLYTTALVLRQIQEGNMSLDEKFNKYLDNHSFKHSSLSVRDLLSHKADYGLELAQYRKEFPDDFKGALLNIQVPSTPSNKIIYHNLNHIYLGYILERITGQSLEHQMITLFNDFDLSNTYIGSTIKKLGINCPATEVLDDGRIIANVTHDESARLHGGLAGNAGVFASARDLAKFGRAWLDGQIINQALLKEALRNYDENGNSPQALGWQMQLKSGTKLPIGVYGHSGFTGCYLAINTNNSEVIAITTNRTFFGRDSAGDQTIWEAVLLRG